MNSILKRVEQLSVNALILILTIISILIAARVHYIQLGSINNDFVIYHEAARLFAANAWQEGFKLFGWPLYSMLIAAIHKTTSLNLQTSAQILSVALFALTTVSFLKIIELAGGNHKTLLAGALILFSSQYIVGDVLPMLVRDHGFWGFFLLSLVFFIRFYQSHTLKHALLWQLAAIAALLFRIETITYLLLLPSLVLVYGNQSISRRLELFLKAHSLTLIIALAITAAIIFSPDLSVKDLGRLKEIFNANLYEKATQKLLERADIMASTVLGNHLEEFAIEGLLMTFAFIIIAKIISTSGWIAIGLAVMTFRKKMAAINPRTRQVLMASMLIALLNMLLIITKVFVLSGRYVIALSLLVMIFAAFYMAHILKYVTNDSKDTVYKKWIVITLIVIMCLSLIKNILPKADSSNFEQDAIAWLKENSLIDQRTYFSTPRLRFYANQNFTDLNHDSWQAVSKLRSNQSEASYERLVILIDETPEARTTELKNYLTEYVVAKEFYSPKNKKKVIIFVRSQ